MILVRDIKFKTKSIIYVILDRRNSIFCDDLDVASSIYGKRETYYIGSLDNNICKKWENKYRYFDTYEQRMKVLDLEVHTQ